MVIAWFVFRESLTPMAALGLVIAAMAVALTLSGRQAVAVGNDDGAITVDGGTRPGRQTEMLRQLEALGLIIRACTRPRRVRAGIFHLR